MRNPRNPYKKLRHREVFLFNNMAYSRWRGQEWERCFRAAAFNASVRAAFRKGKTHTLNPIEGPVEYHEYEPRVGEVLNLHLIKPCASYGDSPTPFTEPYVAP